MDTAADDVSRVVDMLEQAAKMGIRGRECLKYSLVVHGGKEVELQVVSSGWLLRRCSATAAHRVT